MELADIPSDERARDEELKKFCHAWIAIVPASGNKGFGFRGVDWYFALRLAEAWAWEKLGTRASADWTERMKKEWKGEYWPGTGQIVPVDDARNMALALRRALKARDELDQGGGVHRAAEPKGQLLKFLAFDQRETIEQIAKLLESGEHKLIQGW